MNEIPSGLKANADEKKKKWPKMCSFIFIQKQWKIDISMCKIISWYEGEWIRGREGERERE